MSAHKPRPLWHLLTAALIGLPVLYVASFGPACWAVDRGILKWPIVDSFYGPLARLVVRTCPDSGWQILCDYGALGSGRTVHPFARGLIFRQLVDSYSDDASVPD